MASGEFLNIAQYDVDDDLALLLAKRDGTPRLGIYNRSNDKKKYVALSWVEGAERSLKIKVGRSTKEYSMDSILESVAHLISFGQQALSLDTVAWRGVQLLGDLLHMPRTARSEADLKLIAENKRDTLWYAFTPRQEEWRVRPCFVETDAERTALGAYARPEGPWPEPSIPIANDALPATMRNASFVKDLALANSGRWTAFLLPVSRALLLGFSDWSHDEERSFGDQLWKRLPTRDYRTEETLRTMAERGKPFLQRITAYIRLCPLLENLADEMVSDAAKTADEGGFKKRDRFDLPSPEHLGRRYRVTRYEGENESAAFGITPDSRLPGEQDRFLRMAAADWEACLDACSLGGEREPQYACFSLLSAHAVRKWYERISFCLAPTRGGVRA